MAPALSILIPNYNNGRESSPTGRDYLDNLFKSLALTLHDDPTPLEIIVADDGSTDDSLATCRRWAGKTWRGGEPFCRVIELPHSGVLSGVANRLTRAARGALCCRLDGDVAVLTPRFAAALCRIFERASPRLGVVGGKQLSADGLVHSAGDWVLHPRGYHHVAQGAPRDGVTQAREVDHVMGCFYCHRRSIWEELGGYDETLLRGQTVDFGLRVRMGGWTTICAPSIEFIHYNGERTERATEADSEAGRRQSLDRFRDKWGFDRLAPDLDAVAERYAGTPLLWNARVFGPHAPWPPPAAGPVTVEESEWARFASDERFRSDVLLRVAAVNETGRHLGPRRRVCHVHSRGGMFCHLLAQRGAACVGIDRDPRYVELAKAICARQSYPGHEPRFTVQSEPGRLPLADGEVDTVLLLDVVERHPNPAGLYRESRRVLGPGGVLLVVTEPRDGPLDLDEDASHRYRPHELMLQINASRCFEPPVRLDLGDPKLLAVAARGKPEDGPHSGPYESIACRTMFRMSACADSGA